MNINDIWSIALAVITSVGGAGVILFALASWLGKVWASRILETEKIALQLQFANEKSKIDKALHVHNVAASRIDAQRVEAVATLHAALVDWHEAVVDVVAPNDFEKQPWPIGLISYERIASTLRDKSQVLEKVAMRTSIYFSEDTYKLIYECGMAASSMSNTFFDAARVAEADIHKGRIPDRILDARQKLSREYEQTYTPARVAVVTMFRSLVDPNLALGEPKK